MGNSTLNQIIHHSKSKCIVVILPRVRTCDLSEVRLHDKHKKTDAIAEAPTVFFPKCTEFLRIYCATIILIECFKQCLALVGMKPDAHFKQSTRHLPSAKSIRMEERNASGGESEQERRASEDTSLLCVRMLVRVVRIYT